MPDQLVNRLELSRLPFKRRPVAEPGTTIVLQMSDGRLHEPRHPFTTGETWWRGPKAAYVVDVTAHGAAFDCELPSAVDVLFFTATVGYTWRVVDAARLVEAQVTQPEAACRAFLGRWLPTVTSRFEPGRPTDAGRAVEIHAAGATLDLDCGLRIQDVHTALRMDDDRGKIAKELELSPLNQQLAEAGAHGANRIDAIKQQSTLDLQEQRKIHYVKAVAGGREHLMAVVMAQDPTKGKEILDTMIGLSEREEQRALEAIKALMDGGEVRIGELDGVVQATVQRAIAVLGRPTGPITDPGRALPGTDPGPNGST